jgi:hypothetical protein
MNQVQAAECAAKAEDVQDLLQHIGWTDVLQPELQKTAKEYEQAIVQIALGASLTDNMTGQILTIEEVSSRLRAMYWLESILKAILRRGREGVDTLRKDAGFVIN